MTQRILVALAALASVAVIQTVGICQFTFHAPAAVHPSDVDESASRLETSQIGETGLGGVKAPVVVGQKATVENVTVSDRPITVAGHVRQDVIAVRSSVKILPGASVGGHVITFGGSVDNQAGGGVRVVRSSLGALVPIFSPTSTIVQYVRVGPPAVESEASSDRYGRASRRHMSWFEGQFGLFILGMLGGSILLIAAPRATQEVAESVALRPGRSLTIGFITACILTMILSASHLMMQMPKLISLMWSPFGTVIALVSGTLLAFGWLTGMRFAGDRVAHAFGRSSTSDGLFARMTLGLAAFFLINGVLGSISPTLGVASLSLEFAIALMGLGAAIVTRLGKEPGAGLGSGLR